MHIELLLGLKKIEKIISIPQKRFMNTRKIYLKNFKDIHQTYKYNKSYLNGRLNTTQLQLTSKKF